MIRGLVWYWNDGQFDIIGVGKVGFRRWGYHNNSMWHNDKAVWTTMLDTSAKPIEEYRVPIWIDDGQNIYMDNKQFVWWCEYISGKLEFFDSKQLNV